MRHDAEFPGTGLTARRAWLWQAAALAGRALGAALLIGLAACADQTRTAGSPPGLPAGAEPPHDRRPPALDDGWDTASPAAAGIEAGHLTAMTGAIRRYPGWNVHAVLIARDTRLVYEEYFAGQDQRWGQPLGRVVFDRHTKHDLRSVSKSVVSALVGIALASGKIRSVDHPLVEFFPELADLATAEGRRLTVRHALTMSAGLEWNETTIPYTDPKNDEIGMTRSRDPMRYVLSRPVVTEPGITWNYNGGLSQVLGTIVQRATGQRLDEYAESVLFEPLGIRDVDWMGDLAGVPSAASGLRLRARDLAKVGSLYLNAGRWRDRQILPAEWVEESTRRRLPIRASVSAFGTHGYGYQWWHTCYQTGAGTFEAHVAAGNGQQRIFVLPELSLVVTILAGRYNDPTAARLPDRLLLEHVIPAVPRSSGVSGPGRTTGCATPGPPDRR